MTARAGALLILVTLAFAGCGSKADPPMAATEPAPVGSAGPASREGSVSGLRLRQVGTFSNPVYLTAPPGDRRRLFVVEQDGTIRVIRDGEKLDRPFLDITGRVQSGGERGLLSMAFAPDYASSRRFYVYFTDDTGDIRIQEFTGRGDRARKSSARSVLRQNHRYAGNHNGGQLQFGPDGLLYIGTGDGGGGDDPFGAGQDLGTQLGKLLRIDPRGRPFKIPRSNPFRSRSGAKKTVYSYGLRNPWRFSFDRETGDLVIADVGQNEIEEVDFVRKGQGSGANFGWDPFEGNSRHEPGDAPGHLRPVIELSHNNGFCSITGGYVLRNRVYGALQGMYVYSDLCEGTLRGARLTPDKASARTTFGRIAQPSSFGEDARGRVYAISLNGPVYRLVPR